MEEAKSRAVDRSKGQKECGGRSERPFFICVVLVWSLAASVRKQ